MRTSLRVGWVGGGAGVSICLRAFFGQLASMPTVFKKDVQIKSDQKLSGKDAKKIIASVQALYGEEAS